MILLLYEVRIEQTLRFYFGNRACRGKHISLQVRLPNHPRNVEDADFHTHTNESVGTLRRRILNR